MFAGHVLNIPDERRDYGEPRIITVGLLRERMVIVVWTPRGDARHVFSMRKANDREKARFGSDLKKVDRHIIQPHEYDEVPELTDEMAERADLYHGSKLIRRGRPKSDDPKRQITLRLDAAVLRWFQQSGPGYQSRIGAALKIAHDAQEGCGEGFAARKDRRQEKSGLRLPSWK